MTQRTLQLLHQSFNEAVKCSDNIYEILTNFTDTVTNLTVCEEDSESFYLFIDALQSSIRYRSLSFEITNFITFVNFVMMYIVMYIQDVDKVNLDISFYGRRKALVSELTKLLAQSVSVSGVSPSIRDRFGLRGILLNTNIDNFEEDRLIHLLYSRTSAILCKTNRKVWIDFYRWIEENPKINLLDLAVLKAFKDIPLGISYCKDYIRNPKDNGYESLQFTLNVPMYSKVLPGAELEVQFRSKRMHENAEDPDSPQSHENHKEEVVPEEIREVFKIDDLDSHHIVGLSSDEDIDGIVTPKHLTQRRTLFFN